MLRVAPCPLHVHFQHPLTVPTTSPLLCPSPGLPRTAPPANPLSSQAALCLPCSKSRQSPRPAPFFEALPSPSVDRVFPVQVHLIPSDHCLFTDEITGTQRRKETCPRLWFETLKLFLVWLAAHLPSFTPLCPKVIYGPNAGFCLLSTSYAFPCVLVAPGPFPDIPHPHLLSLLKQSQPILKPTIRPWPFSPH